MIDEDYEDDEITGSERLKFAAPRLLVVVVGISVLLCNHNWKAIFYPKLLPTNFDGLWTVLFTPLNVVLLGFGVTISLLILLFLLIRLLFTPLDEINILGVGYKARAKKQQRVAFKEANLYRKIDVVRMSIITTLGEPDFREKISTNYNSQTNVFETLGILIELSDVVETTFSLNIEEINLEAGVVAVETGILENSQLNNLPINMRNTIEESFRLNKPINNQGEVIAVPLKMEEEDTTFCIFYMTNSDKLFNIADQLFIQNAWHKIKNEVKLIILESETLEEIIG